MKLTRKSLVAASGYVETDYGTVDEAIEPDSGNGLGGIFGEEDHHEDNRDDPPDNGVLIQLGGRDVFDLCIRGMPSAEKSPKKSGVNKGCFSIFGE